MLQQTVWTLWHQMVLEAGVLAPMSVAALWGERHAGGILVNGP